MHTDFFAALLGVCGISSFDNGRLCRQGPGNPNL
jgi:hypothetical protein